MSAPFKVLAIKRRPDEPCTYAGCGRPYHGKGYCFVHYERARRGEDMSAPFKQKVPADGLCTLPYCQKPYSALGLCGFHRHRNYLWNPHRLDSI